MEQMKLISEQKSIQNNTVAAPHGLLAEDFKQNILNLVQNHQLDIQTKVIILDLILSTFNIVAKQQTQIELNEFKKMNQNNESNNSKKEIS